MTLNNTLYEALQNRGKILSKADIMEVIADYNKQFNQKKSKYLLKYLSRQGYVKRIFSSLYYINSFDEKNRKLCQFEDKEVLFMALNKLAVKWYVGLGYASYLQGKKWQTPNQISIINTKFSGIKNVFGLKVKFFKTKESFIFGLKTTKTKHNIAYFYSDSAKTYIDKVYFRETDNLIKIKNTKEYLRRYPKWVGKK